MVNDARVLLISGDTGLIEDVRRITGGIGRIDVDVVASLDRAYGYAGWEQVTLVLIHHDGSGSFAEVGRFLRMMAAARRPSPTIVLADSCDRDRTAEVLRSGVADLLMYPFEMARMSYLIDTLTLRSRRPRVTIAVNSDKEPASPVKSDPIVGLALQVAPLDATILIQGEEGTGKSVLAAAIHDHSERRNGPFLTIRCATLPPEGPGDEFFGDVDSPYDSPYSDSPSHLVRVRGGTLVLDDVDTLSYQSQIALIRWIESRPAEEPGAADRPRLIATTRLSLADEVTLGRFRSDLFYRLNVIGLQLDPLRERGEEIRIAARSILEELAGSTVSLSADAIRAIEAHSWSGNFRELREVLESALSHRRGPVLDRDVLPTLVRTAVSVPSTGFSLTRLSDATLAQTKCDAEFARITQTLEKHNQNRLRTARELGISRMTLYKKLYKYGIIGPGGQAGPSSMRSPARAAKPILPTSEGSGGFRYR